MLFRQIFEPKLAQYAKARNDVHYTREGYALLGKQVAETIAATLKERPVHSRE